MDSMQMTIDAQAERIKALETFPEKAVCPITQSAINELVVCSVDGQCYERDAIRTWLELNPTSPLTKAPAEVSSLHAATNIHDHVVHLHCEIEKLRKEVSKQRQAKIKAQMRAAQNRPIKFEGLKMPPHEEIWVPISGLSVWYKNDKNGKNGKS